MSRIKNLKGTKFNRLEVLELEGTDNNGNVVWICKCDCGEITKVKSYNLSNGNSQSCGCLHNELFGDITRTHGKSKTRLYKIYTGIKYRCNKNKWYKGRGISICEEWDDFEPFYEWALNNGYKKNLTIDRIDNDGDYSPDNCRWITNSEQQNNKQDTIYIDYNGEKLTLIEIAERENLKYHCIYSRYKRGRYKLYKKGDGN